MMSEQDLSENIQQRELEEHDGVGMMQALLLAVPVGMALWCAVLWGVVALCR